MQGNTYNQAANSYAICIANNGYTLRPRDLTTPVKGYVVSLSTTQPELIKDTDFTVEMYVKSFNDVARSILNDNQGTMITEYVNNDQELIKVSTDLCVGAWLHEGYWYVEKVQVVADQRDALYLAKANSQKAIWDLSEKKEIFIDQVMDTKSKPKEIEPDFFFFG